MRCISFNPAMLAAVRAGRKTVTRRRLPPDSPLQQEPDRYSFVMLTPQGAIFEDLHTQPATQLPPVPLPFGPAGQLLQVQEDSSLQLKIVSVRAEQVRCISEADAVAEGVFARPKQGPPRWGSVEPDSTRPGDFQWYNTPLEAFRVLLNSIYPTAWARNEWVWVIAFERR